MCHGYCHTFSSHRHRNILVSLTWLIAFKDNFIDLLGEINYLTNIVQKYEKSQRAICIVHYIHLDTIICCILIYITELAICIRD